MIEQARSHRLRRLMVVAFAPLAICAAACSSDESPDVASVPITQEPANTAGDTGDTDARADPAVVLAADGLAITGPGAAATPLPFGSGEDELRTAVERVLGPAVVEPSPPDCGNGSERLLTWPGQLRAEIIGGEFVGWYAGPASALTTVEGVGPGSTLPELRATATVEVLDTSLGNEFRPADGVGLSGLLDGPAGAVTDTWAGSVCIFR